MLVSRKIICDNASNLIAQNVFGHYSLFRGVVLSGTSTVEKFPMIKMEILLLQPTTKLRHTRSISLCFQNTPCARKGASPFL